MTPRYPQNTLLLGLGWELSSKSPIEGGKKVHLFMGMTIRLKTMSNVPVGFPEYGMTNASNFRWGLLLPATPKSERRGTFIYGNDAKAKKWVP